MPNYSLADRAVIITGAAGGIGAASAGRLIAIEADDVVGDLVVNRVHRLQRLAPSLDELRDRSGVRLTPRQ